MSEIKPALTPEEWAKEEVQRFTRAAGRFDAGLTSDGRLELAVGWEETGDDAYRVYHPIDDRHALAALALHGQPFGFDWEDVDALRNASAAVSSYAIDDDQWSSSGRLDRLADRIAALLPPRKP